MSMVRYTVIIDRPISADGTQHHHGVGTQAAALFTEDLRRVFQTDEARRLLGDVDVAVAARRFVGIHELPLSVLGDTTENHFNYDDNPEVIP